MSILMPDLWQRVRLASPWLHLNSIGEEEEEEQEGGRGKKKLRFQICALYKIYIVYDCI